jgi:hypothetical protein
VNTSSLNSDGSGRVNMKDANGKPFWVEFDPGRGPRKIRYNFNYRACVWLLNPA